MVTVAGRKAGAISTEQIEDADFEEVVDHSDKEIVMSGDTSLGRFIKVWDQALPEKYCKKIVELYASSGEQQIVRTDQGSFVSCNIDRAPEMEKIAETQKSIIEATLPIYAEAVEPDPSSFPEQSSLEDSHIYHFRNENDYKEMGHDIKHVAQARRYMTMIWFLSESEDFYLQFGAFGAKVESKVGRLVIFPSTWTYPYQILNSNKQNYLVKTHLDFI